MLTKIISGGQTGADRAALDVAIKFNMPYAGWIPRGRRTEEGPLPEKYRLFQMATTDYRDRTRQNIIDSQGTVVICRGALTGGSLLTRQFAKVVGRPCCQVDLSHNDTFEGAVILHSFILENRLSVLNVAGPRASQDPGIYFEVKSILEAVLYMLYLDRDSAFENPFVPPDGEGFPSDADTAVLTLAKDLSLRDKTLLARQTDGDITDIYFAWLEPVRARLGFDAGNQTLLSACKKELDPDIITEEDGVMALLKALKQHCSSSFQLRVVK